MMRGLAPRRIVLAGGIAGLVGGRAMAQPSPESLKRPQKGDTLVVAGGPRAGQVVQPSDLALGGPQLLVWAADPATGMVRDGSRLNQVLLVHLDIEALAPVTRDRAAEGIVAYSAICSHAQCPVTEWRHETGILHCPCHNSEFDPKENAKVVNGPATRSLAALPMGLSEGKLVVAGPFLGKVGAAAV